MFIATLAALTSLAAYAQDPVTAGTVFTVKDISSADGYFAQKAALVGKECTASGQLTVTPGTTWYGGPAACGGSTYYFYQVAIVTKATYASANAYSMPAGTPFVVRDIASDDAYATTRAAIVGLNCVAGNGMSRTDGAWWAGPAKCATDASAASGGKDYYFYKMAFDTTGTAPVASSGMSSATIDAIAAGSTFILRDIHAEDAYFSSKSEYVGQTCTAGPDMYRTEGPWWAGSATCGGSSMYFYKAAFDVTSATATTATYGSATAAATLYPPTQVTIRDIQSDDIYYSQKNLLVGQTCTVAAELHRNDGQWYGGDVNCPNGAYYYFYKVAFDVSGTATLAPSSGYGSATAPSPLNPPTQFIVRDIAPDDAYYPSMSQIVGQTCTVNGDLHRQDGQWYGGAANCGPSATYYYFYKVAFDLVGGASGGYGSSGAPETVAQGTSLTIRAVAPDDGYASSASTLTGLSCTVGPSGLSRTDGAWFGGDVNCSDGNYYYFYKMAFDFTSMDTYPSGTLVTITDVAADDAYYSDRGTIIGKSCTVAADLHKSVDDWYGGDVNCSDGSYYYFYKVKFTTGGSASFPTGGRYSGYSIPKKAWVTIADISPDDAFYAYKDALIGNTCQVKKQDLTSTGEAWFGGTLKCNGSKLYFYQVGVIY